NRDDVAGADLLVAGGDAVDHGIVDADAGSGREAVQVQEVRACAVAHYEIVDDLVDLRGGDTGFDRSAAGFESSRADFTGTPHLGQFRGIFDLNHGRFTPPAF